MHPLQCWDKWCRPDWSDYMPTNCPSCWVSQWYCCCCLPVWVGRYSLIMTGTPVSTATLTVNTVIMMDSAAHEQNLGRNRWLHDEFLEVTTILYNSLYPLVEAASIDAWVSLDLSHPPHCFKQNRPVCLLRLWLVPLSSEVATTILSIPKVLPGIRCHFYCWLARMSVYYVLPYFQYNGSQDNETSLSPRIWQQVCYFSVEAWSRSWRSWKLFFN